MLRRESVTRQSKSCARRTLCLKSISMKCGQAYSAYLRADSSRPRFQRDLETPHSSKHHRHHGADADRDGREHCWTLLRRIVAGNKVVRTRQRSTHSADSNQEQEKSNRFSADIAHSEWLASLGARGAALAHELKQPLTVVSLSIDDALDRLEAAFSYQKCATEELKEALGQIPNLTSIVGRFRNLARYPSTCSTGHADVRRTAERIAELFNGNPAQFRIILRLGETKSLPPLGIDRRDLEQLFFALFENAAHAAGGMRNRQLIVDGNRAGNHVVLRFADNCCGILPENVDKIFDPFFTTKTRGQGTGLGLFLVRQIVSQVGGRVAVKSKFSIGSAFTVTLPANEDEATLATGQPTSDKTLH